MIIALANQKGGVGKSSTAVHCASWLSTRGSVFLVDADTQQSSSSWCKDLEIPANALLDPEELFDNLPKLASEYDAVVVDGPGGLSEITKAILARADLVLVPCQPTGLDLRSSNKILRFIAQAQELRGGNPKACLFLNRATKGTLLLKESQTVLSEQPIPLLKTIIYQRQCIADAPGQGKTVFNMPDKTAIAAAKDYQALFQEALGQVK